MRSALQVIGQANFDTISEWVRLLDALANDAEALAADEPHCAADQTSYNDKWCALGDRWFSLLWASMTPAFIAKSARRARAELRPVEVRLQPPLTDAEKAEDTARAVAMAKTATQIETPEKAKPEPADWGDYSERKRAEREAAVMAQQERILAAVAAPVPLVDEPAPDELPEAWQTEPEPIAPEVVWLKSDELGAALGVSQSEITHWQRRGLFDSEGLTRRPHPGEGRGRRFDLVACREIYLARPRRRKPPAPLPVVIEPTAPAPTPEAAADAAALLELAGGDAGTLAALRELLA